MNGAVLGRLAVLLADGKDQAGGKVAVNVRALQRGDSRAPVNVATGDADTVAVTGEFTILLKPGVVGVLNDRVDPVALGRAVLLKLVERLANVPAVVPALGDEVDLFPLVLPDICRPQLTGLAVDAHAPNVSQTVGPDFLARVVLAIGERIVGRDAVLQVAAAAVDVNAQDFAEQVVEVLRVVVRVVGFAAVAGTDIELAILAKQHHATIMIPIRLRELEQDALRLHVRLVFVGLGHGELTHHTALGILLGIVDVKFLVRLEVRVKRQPKQPLLILDPRLAVVDVEELNPFLAGLGLGQDYNPAALLYAEQPAGAIRRSLQPEWPVQFQTLPYRLQPHLGKFRLCRGQADCQR